MHIKYVDAIGVGAGMSVSVEEGEKAALPYGR